MFRIIFVLDILNGTVVHAVRGERSKYQPVSGSVVCESSDPLDIVSALAPREVYIADLDRLQHRGENLGIIRKISERTRVMADIGAENMEDVKKCAIAADNIILGTETASLRLIEEASRSFPGRVIVSIDIRNDKVLTADGDPEPEPLDLVKILNNYDLCNIIILEISRVGTGAGIDEEFLKSMVRASSHDVLAGGGVKDMDDILALERIGVSGALVATAVHNGKIPSGLIRMD